MLRKHIWGMIPSQEQMIPSQTSKLEVQLGHYLQMRSYPAQKFEICQSIPSDALLQVILLKKEMHLVQTVCYACGLREKIEQNMEVR